ncbi:MAG TPA: SpoIIE family protein phosphatase [Trebonia sp.]|nr:SpoIIE family protein phosphatase [Trebonia sp.]
MSDSPSSLAVRRDALREAAGIPDGDPRALLDAALTELDAAIDALAGTGKGPGDGGAEATADSLPEAVRAERRLLHAAFQDAPIPLLLLELDGTIRRANAKAADLLGSPTGYATGRALTVFVDLSFRAAVHSQLAAVARTGNPRQGPCRVLTAGGPLEAVLAASAIAVPGEPPLLVATITPSPPAGGRKKPAGKAGPAKSGPGQATAGPPDAPREAAIPADAASERAVKSLTKRLDMVTAVTRVLLDNSTFSEAVTLQRCARLLAGELADWVIVDVERGGRLRRQFAAGPRTRQAEETARAVRGVDPDPASLPGQVQATRKPLLLAHVDNPGLLGADSDGRQVLMSLGATSLLCVPIADEMASYGTLTLARTAAAGHFGVADLALAQELGQHLAIAMRVDRMFRHRSEVAETLQASLLPARLPAVPGLELAAAYIGATQSQEVSGDFYDVFRSQDAWAIAIGDVCGKGQEAAAMTAAARHAIRALAHVRATPQEVLAAANDVLVAGDYDERFVTAKLAVLEHRDGGLLVRLGSAGHPGPAVVRADGRVEILEGDGLPLGLFPQASLSHMELELATGDLLFFYTDGVTEARSMSMEFFEDRLADELAAMAGRSATQTVRAVQELVTTFSQGELRDDVTILAVRVGEVP